MIVHCLHEGRALCGRPGVPRDWHADESWLSLADWPLSQREIDRHDGAVSMCTGCVVAVADREKEGA